MFKDLDMMIELDEDFRSEGDSYIVTQKQSMTAADHQKLSLLQMKNSMDPTSINHELLGEILTKYFTFKKIKKEAPDFNIASAVVLLSLFLDHVEKHKIDNKKK